MENLYKETVFEDSEVEIVKTNRDYDFVAYIRNKTKHDILVEFKTDDLVYYTVKVEADDWVGLFQNEFDTIENWIDTIQIIDTTNIVNIDERVVWGECIFDMAGV